MKRLILSILMLIAAVSVYSQYYHRSYSVYHYGVRVSPYPYYPVSRTKYKNKIKKNTIIINQTENNYEENISTNVTNQLVNGSCNAQANNARTTSASTQNRQYRANTNSYPKITFWFYCNSSNVHEYGNHANDDNLTNIMDFKYRHPDAKLLLNAYSSVNTGTHDRNYVLAVERGDNIREALRHRGFPISDIHVNVVADQKQPYNGDNERNQCVIAEFYY